MPIHPHCDRNAIGFFGFTIDEHGKVLILRNEHRDKDQDLSNWKIVRTVDHERIIEFTFPRNYILGAKEQVKIWAKTRDGRSYPPGELIMTEDTWGTGEHLRSVLNDDRGFERASHVKMYANYGKHAEKLKALEHRLAENCNFYA